MAAYYNEWDAYAAQWLRNLIAAGHIAPGDVDERSITEVQADDLRGYDQCHFFAGIGGWPFSLRLAGWPDDRPVWSASCPCQPYSVGNVAHGGAKGADDERDLWPDLFALARQRRPPRIYGEQVADAISWGWWDRAAWDMESEGYACAAAVLRASGFGARHQRKRLYWVAHASGEGREGHIEIERFPIAERAAFTLYGNPLADAGRALDGDYSGLLPCDGVSFGVERCAAKGYGNAIVPQVAAAFIGATDQ